MWRLLKWLLAAGAVLFVLIQFIPYGRDHENPAGSGRAGLGLPRPPEIGGPRLFRLSLQ